MLLRIVFWVLAALWLNWGLAFFRILVDPNWYIERRIHAGLDFTVSTKRVLTIKGIQMAGLGWGLWVLGGGIGYW